MTIASEISKLQTNLTDSYTACTEKGATIPSHQNMDNLPACISSIVKLNGETRTESLTSSSSTTYTPGSGYNAITSITVAPTNLALTITPTTYSQEHTIPANYSGYGTVTVNAVTSAIDANITAGNIKNGVEILGVTGNYGGEAPVLETLTVSPSVSLATYTPSTGYDGFDEVTVNAVTAAIDNNIVAGNIRTGVEILGVTGNYSGGGASPVIDSLNVTPTTSAQQITAPEGTDGYSPVNVSAVTSAIDANITAGNIKKDVTILGVTGNYEGTTPTLTTKEITINGTYYASTDNADGYSSVTVNVSGGGFTTGIPREVSSLGVYQVPMTTSFTFSLPSGVTSIGSRALGYAFAGSTGLTSIDLSGVLDVSESALTWMCVGCTNLTSVDLGDLEVVGEGNGMSFAFQGCTSLTSVDLSSLTTVSGSSGMYQAFYGCTSLTSVSFPSLTTVSGTSGMQYAFQNCRNLTSVDLTSLETVSGGIGMSHVFQDCISLTSVDLSSLTTVSGSQALVGVFQGCTSLTSVSFPSLTTISGSNGMSYAFQGCTSLTSVDLSSLTTVSVSQGMSGAFSGCTNLTSVDFSSLEQIGTDSSSTNYGHFSNAFYNCNNLTSVSFPELTAIYCTGGSPSDGTFYNNTKVQKFYFPKLTTITYGTGASSANQNACKQVFSNCSSLTELHFGAANQSAIEASPGYSTAWGRGAGNVTIYFDL